MNEIEWTEKLSPLVERDNFIRDALVKRGTLNDSYHKEMEKVHLYNAKKLKDLIDTHGFPVLSSAGEKGVQLSWLIIQHAISWPDFMLESLTQMRLAAAASDYPLDLLARTEDRIRIYQGHLQIYGTNLDWQDGELKPTPCEMPESLNLRRKSMGLPPLEDGGITVSSERPPLDVEKKHQEYLEWLKKVGWRI